MSNNIIFQHLSTIQNNREIIKQDKKYQKIISELETIVNFIIEFTDLSFGRDFISCNEKILSLQIISTSFEMTAENIVLCCKSGCLADANSLLRKYFDDLLFFLYIVIYDKEIRLDGKNQKSNKIEDNIVKWLNNTLTNLRYEDIINLIKTNNNLQDAVEKYDLKNKFYSIRGPLNNFMHSNGIIYYNRSTNKDNDKDLAKQMQDLLKNLRFITISFLFLLTLYAPCFIMSSDYIDYLECGMTPPKDSQYWVAPFISDFFKKNLDLIDINCITYLRENTCMKI